MQKIFVTRKIREEGITLLKEKGFEVFISPKDRPLEKKELVKFLKKDKYDAVLSLLTDKIDSEVFDASPTTKIFANYAIGFNNIDVEEAKKRNIFVTNTPGGGADRVAEHAFALILALTCRVVEGDKYMKKARFKGWDPLLLHGTKLAGKTLGVLGTGQIGGEVARKAKHGFGMDVVYYDIKRNEKIESESSAVYKEKVEDVLKVADVVSIHVPLLPTTKHLINKENIKMFKKGAYLINTSRGPVVEEEALVESLESGSLAGAGLDVFEFEPKISRKLLKRDNCIITPHIASATLDSRVDMSIKACQNIIDCLEGIKPRNNVY